MPMVMVGDAKFTAENLAKANTRFVSADKPARYPQGNKALVQFFLQNINYSPEYRDGNKRKNLTVKFTVDKEGKAGNGQVIGAANPQLETTILNLINKLPDFIPAERNGEKVNATVELPITLRMLNL